LLTRHELVDFDRVIALDSYRIEFFVFDLDLGALRIFIPATLVGALHRFARFLVDQLLSKPVACLLIDLPKGAYGN